MKMASESEQPANRYFPTLVCVYSFPMELQITVSGFIGATQALLFIFIGRKA